MIEIASNQRLAIVPLVAFALVCVLAAFLVLFRAAQHVRRRRVYRSTIVAGLACALASGALWSTRHAGTGTEIAWGWPRAVYTRWLSWETDERRAGVRWQGIAENMVFYGALAALVGSIAVAARRSAPG